MKRHWIVPMLLIALSLGFLIYDIFIEEKKDPVTWWGHPTVTAKDGSIMFDNEYEVGFLPMNKNGEGWVVARRVKR